MSSLVLGTAQEYQTPFMYYGFNPFLIMEVLQTLLGTQTVLKSPLVEPYLTHPELIKASDQARGESLVSWSEVLCSWSPAFRFARDYHAVFRQGLTCQFEVDGA
jgi:hypothetical protein